MAGRVQIVYKVGYRVQSEKLSASRRHANCGGRKGFRAPKVAGGADCQ